jgi:hypothetical protein
MTMKKTHTQLDREIDKALSTRRRRTVEGLRIPPNSREALNRFWKTHPTLRKECLTKYSFDPINEEASYWRFGLAEPDHKDVLRAVRQNRNVFSLELVKRWQIEELRASL